MCFYLFKSAAPPHHLLDKRGDIKYLDSQEGGNFKKAQNH